MTELPFLGIRGESRRGIITHREQSWFAPYGQQSGKTAFAGWKAFAVLSGSLSRGYWALDMIWTLNATEKLRFCGLHGFRHGWCVVTAIGVRSDKVRPVKWTEACWKGPASNGKGEVGEVMLFASFPALECQKNEFPCCLELPNGKWENDSSTSEKEHKLDSVGLPCHTPDQYGLQPVLCLLLHEKHPLSCLRLQLWVFLIYPLLPGT